MQNLPAIAPSALRRPPVPPVPKETEKPLSLELLQQATQQLAFLLDASVPLLSALTGVAQGGDETVRATFLKVSTDIERGMSLSESMGLQPQTFSALYRRSILSAEKTGQLGPAFLSLAEHLAYQVDTRRRLRAALTYPACVITVSVLMVAFLLYVQVPNFIKMFASTDQTLPFATQILVVVSNPKLLLVLLPCLAILSLAFRGVWRTPEGKRNIVHRLYKAPILGRLLGLRDGAQFATELATLLDNGVDLLTALKAIGSEKVLSPYFEAIPSMTNCVKNGRSLAQALQDQTIFPRLLTSLIEVSEEFGTPAAGLRQYSDMSMSQLNDTIDAALQLVEPLVMGFLGLTVVFIAIASFLPIYQLATG